MDFRGKDGGGFDGGTWQSVGSDDGPWIQGGELTWYGPGHRGWRRRGPCFFYLPFSVFFSQNKQARLLTDINGSTNLLTISDDPRSMRSLPPRVQNPRSIFPLIYACKYGGLIKGLANLGTDLVAWFDHMLYN